MSFKRNDIRAAISLPSADQVVSELLSDAEAKEQEMQLSPGERRWIMEQRKKEKERVEKARRKEKAQRPNKVSYLIPVDLRLKIKAIATEYSAPESQVATFLLFEGLRLHEQEELDFLRYLHPSNSPRYDSQLIHPDDEERLNRVAKKSR